MMRPVLPPCAKAATEKRHTNKNTATIEPFLKIRIVGTVVTITSSQSTENVEEKFFRTLSLHKIEVNGPSHLPSSSLFPVHVNEVFFVLAEVFHQFGVWHEIERNGHSPRPLVVLGICECEFDHEMAEVGPAVLFGD